MKRYTIEMKVGIFAAVMIILLAWLTMKVNERGAVMGGGYKLNVELADATGLKRKAPVLLAGVEVGVVDKVTLTPERRALAELMISKNVILPTDTEIVIRTKGFLGETYVEIIPGGAANKLGDGDNIGLSKRTGDINTLVSQFGDIANDIKAITGAMKQLMGDANDSKVAKMINNWEQLSETLNLMALRNENNIDRITASMADFSENIQHLIAQSKDEVSESMDHIASITAKIDRGEGTVGKLINDDETVEKLNATLDNLQDTLGGFRKLEMEIGYHNEYLTRSKDFKHYVSLALRPAPDKAFMFDLVSDPNPNPTHIDRTTDITVNNNTTTVSTTTATTDRSKLRFSAQLAKSFYDFRFRAGIIESTGGIGLDYIKGPMGLRFSVYDFSTRYGERPHLKMLGDVGVTKNFYLLGGADDFINPNQRVDWFVGIGLRLIDEDIKRLASFGGGSLLGK
ncbi:MAG: MlaD family protein [Pseudomonadota bacterium]